MVINDCVGLSGRPVRFRAPGRVIGDLPTNFLPSLSAWVWIHTLTQFLFSPFFCYGLHKFWTTQLDPNKSHSHRLQKANSSQQTHTELANPNRCELGIETTRGGGPRLCMVKNDCVCLSGRQPVRFQRGSCTNKSAQTFSFWSLGFSSLCFSACPCMFFCSKAECNKPTPAQPQPHQLRKKSTRLNTCTPTS
jgi:hypothetical protein